MRNKRRNTKTAKLFTTILLFAGFITFGQTKTFVGTLEDYTCGDDRCSFGIKKADGNFYDENITLEYVSGKPKLNPEFHDIVIKNGENETLNPKYQGKKVSFTCMVKNNIYYVNKIEDPSKAQASITEAKDNFTKATCKLYDNHGTLKHICETQLVYKVKEGEKKGEGKQIQNKNEMCKGDKCIKVKLDAQGFINLYNLPNTTENRIVGKVVGNKIYSCNAKNDTQLNLHATFKGDKNQAALIIIYEGFYR